MPVDPVRAFFAHIYGCPMSYWCATWIAPGKIQHFLTLYDLGLDKFAPRLCTEIKTYLHDRLHADFKHPP